MSREREAFSIIDGARFSLEQVQCLSTIDEDRPLGIETDEVQKFLFYWDQVFLYGSKSYRRGYWSFVSGLSHPSLITEVKETPGAVNDLMRSRIWLGLVLNGNELEYYLTTIRYQQQLLAKNYQTHAILRNRNHLEDLISISCGQEQTIFNLHLDHLVFRSRELFVGPRNNTSFSRLFDVGFNWEESIRSRSSSVVSRSNSRLSSFGFQYHPSPSSGSTPITTGSTPVADNALEISSPVSEGDYMISNVQRKRSGIDEDIVEEESREDGITPNTDDIISASDVISAREPRRTDTFSTASSSPPATHPVQGGGRPAPSPPIRSSSPEPAGQDISATTSGQVTGSPPCTTTGSGQVTGSPPYTGSPGSKKSSPVLINSPLATSPTELVTSSPRESSPVAVPPPVAVSTSTATGAPFSSSSLAPQEPTQSPDVHRTTPPLPASSPDPLHLTSSPDPRLPASSPDPRLRDLLPGTPSTSEGSSPLQESRSSPLRDPLQEAGSRSSPLRDPIQESGSHSSPLRDPRPETGSRSSPLRDPIQESGSRSSPLRDPIQESGSRSSPLRDPIQESGSSPAVRTNNLSSPSQSTALRRPCSRVALIADEGEGGGVMTSSEDQIMTSSSPGPSLAKLLLPGTETVLSGADIFEAEAAHFTITSEAEEEDVDQRGISEDGDQSSYDRVSTGESRGAVSRDPSFDQSESSDIDPPGEEGVETMEMDSPEKQQEEYDDPYEEEEAGDVTDDITTALLDDVTRNQEEEVELSTSPVLYMEQPGSSPVYGWDDTLSRTMTPGQRRSPPPPSTSQPPSLEAPATPQYAAGSPSSFTSPASSPLFPPAATTVPPSTVSLVQSTNPPGSASAKENIPDFEKASLDSTIGLYTPTQSQSITWVMELCEASEDIAFVYKVWLKDTAGNLELGYFIGTTKGNIVLMDPHFVLKHKVSFINIESFGRGLNWQFITLFITDTDSTTYQVDVITGCESVSRGIIQKLAAQAQNSGFGIDWSGEESHSQFRLKYHVGTFLREQEIFEMSLIDDMHYSVLSWLPLSGSKRSIDQFPISEGKLMLKEPYLLRYVWTEYYFILDKDGKLSQFEGTDCAGRIKQTYTVIGSGGCRKMTKKETSKAHAFRFISDEGVEVMLNCDSAQDRDRWISTISKTAMEVPEAPGDSSYGVVCSVVVNRKFIIVVREGFRTAYTLDAVPIQEVQTITWAEEECFCVLKSEHKEWILLFRDNYEKYKMMEYIWEQWSELFHCPSPELLFSRAFPATKEWNGPNAVWRRYDEFLSGAMQSRDNSEFEFLGDDS